MISLYKFSLHSSHHYPLYFHQFIYLRVVERLLFRKSFRNTDIIRKNFNSEGNFFPVSKKKRMNNKIDTEITLFRRVSSIPSVSRISHGSSNWVRFRRRSAGQDTHPSIYTRRWVDSKGKRRNGRPGCESSRMKCSDRYR